jgi:hypothetical protein
MVTSRLEQLFEQGVLVRPTDRQPNLVHLVRALYTLAGAHDLASHPVTAALVDRIGRADHLVFILLDGLGMNIIRRLPDNSFLRAHVVEQIQATCPSTTACALSTVATAQYPNRHGTAGWFTHVPELGRTITTLPFIDRFTGEPLASKSITVEQVLLQPPIYPRLTHRALTVVPALIANTAFNTFMRAGTVSAGYYSIPHAIERVVAHVTQSAVPTYTHLYLPEIDTICHKRGVGDPEVVTLVLQIDEQIRALAQALAGRARIVVSADHGLIDVPVADQTLLTEADPMIPLLQVPPSGDARMPIFHVRPERRDEFVHMFQERFGDRLLLLRTGELERLELCGLGAFSPRARERFGDFVGIPLARSALSFHPPNKPIGHLYIALHAG